MGFSYEWLRVNQLQVGMFILVQVATGDLAASELRVTQLPVAAGDFPVQDT